MDYSPGLRGVIAGETEISTVGMEGTSLRYRGYDAVGLTSTNTYEDVASLIIYDDLDGLLLEQFQVTRVLERFCELDLVVTLDLVEINIVEHHLVLFTFR